MMIKFSLFTITLTALLSGMALPAWAGVTGMDAGAVDVSGEVFQPTCALTISDGALGDQMTKPYNPTTATDPAELTVHLGTREFKQIAINKLVVVATVTLSFQNCPLNNGTLGKLYFPDSDNPHMTSDGEWQDLTQGHSTIHLTIAPSTGIIKQYDYNTLSNSLPLDKTHGLTRTGTGNTYNLNYPITLYYDSRNVTTLTAGSFQTTIGFTIAYE